MDENTFYVCSAQKTKLVQDLVVSDFLAESDGMDETLLMFVQSGKLSWWSDRLFLIFPWSLMEWMKTHLMFVQHWKLSWVS